MDPEYDIIMITTNDKTIQASYSSFIFVYMAMVLETVPSRWADRQVFVDAVVPHVQAAMIRFHRLHVARRVVQSGVHFYMLNYLTTSRFGVKPVIDTALVEQAEPYTPPSSPLANDNHSFFPLDSDDDYEGDEGWYSDESELDYASDFDYVEESTDDITDYESDVSYDDTLRRLHDQMLLLARIEPSGDLEPQGSEYESPMMAFLTNRHKFVADVCMKYALNDPRISATIEQHILLVMNLYQCQTLSHAITTLIAHVSAVYTDSGICSVVKDYINNSFFDLEKQALDAETLPQMWDSWKVLADSDIVQKFKKLFSVLAAAGVCSIAGFSFLPSKFEEIWNSGVFVTICSNNLVGYGVEAFVTFYKCGLRAWNEGSLWAIFKDKQLLQFDLDYSSLISQEDMFYTGTFSGEHNIKSAVHYRVTLGVTIEACKETIIRRDVSEQTRNIMRAKLKNLTVILDKIITFNNSQNVREAPFSFLFWGDSGVGKSCLIPLLQNALMRANGVDPDPCHWVTINGDDKYMSEYNQNHLGVVMDDLANIKQEYCEGVPATNIIKMANNIPMAVIKAEIELKGKVYMEPKWLIVTSNIQDLDATKVSNAPISIARRMNYTIRVVVRDSYQSETLAGKTGMLDPRLMGAPGTDDAWLFEVCQAVQENERNPRAQAIRYVPVPGMCGVGADKLIKFLTLESVSHAARQKNFVQGSRDIFNVALCEHSSYPSLCSACNLENQAGGLDAWLIEYAKSSRWWVDIKFSSLPGVDFAFRRGLYSVVKSGATGSFLSLAIGLFALLWAAAIGLMSAYWGGFTCVIISYLYLIVRGIKHRLAHKALSGTPLQGIADMQASEWLKGLCVLTGVLAVFNIFKFAMSAAGVMESQGASHSCPEPDPVQKDNPWVRPHIQQQELNVSMSRASHNDCAKVISDKMVTAGFSGGNVTGQRACMLPIYSNLWVVPYHVVKSGYTKVEGFYVDDPNGISRNFVAMIGRDSWERIGETDLALLCLPTAGDQRDLRKYFPITRSFEGVSAEFIYRNTTCDIIRGNARFEPSTAKVINDTGSFHAMSGIYPFPTRAGMCGGVALSNTLTPYIVGFHVAGAPNGGSYGQCCQVVLSEITATSDKLRENRMNVPAASYDKLELQSTKFMIELTGQLHAKSPFNFQESGGNMLLYGSHNQERRHLRSRCNTSIISNAVDSIMGRPREHGPPMNYSNYKPWNLDAKGMLAVKQIPYDLLKPAFNDYLDDVKRIVESQPERVGLISPLVREAVLSGVDGCLGIDCIDLRTSAGWPYNTPKIRLVEIDTVKYPGITRVVLPTAEIQEEIDNVEEQYRLGYRCHLAFRVSLKDEATKLGKEKVRTIAGAPFAMLYLCRKYFLPVAKFIRENAVEFETAVGVVAQGPEWDELAKSLNRFEGGRKVAGDYGAFDTSMSCMVTYLAFSVMIYVAEVAGYTPSDIQVMWSIATEICNPLYEFNGEFMKANGSMPSGHPLTVFINGIVNSFYVRIAFYMIATDTLGHSNLKFKDYVHLITYGDDNAMDVSPDIDGFNHTTMSNALASIGLKYTMADKTAESVPFIPFSEVTFLKRSFVRDEGTGCYFAPLEESSLFKMLHCNLDSVALTPAEQSAQNLQTFCQEAFWHGEAYYNMRLPQLNAVVSQCDLSTYLQGGCLPTYDELRANHMPTYEAYLGV